MKKLVLLLLFLTPLVQAMEPETMTKEVQLKEALAKYLESRGSWVRSVEGWDEALKLKLINSENGTLLNQFLAQKMLAQCPRVKQSILSFIPIPFKDVLCDEGSFFTVSCNSTGNRMVTTSCRTEKFAKVWNVDTGALHCILTGHRDIVDNAIFSLDGLKVATGSQDGTVKIWNAHSGQHLTTIDLKRGAEMVHSNVITFDPTGNFIIISAAGSGVRHTQIWDIQKGECAHVLDGVAADSGMFNPKDPDEVAIGPYYYGEMKLWNTARKDLQTLNAVDHKNARVYTVRFNQDGTSILTGSACGIKLLDAKTGQLSHDFGSQYGTFVEEDDLLITFVDGSTCIGNLSIWDSTTFERIKKIKFNDFNVDYGMSTTRLAVPCQCASTPTGDKVFYNFRNGIRIYDLKQFLEVYTFLKEDITIPQAAILYEIFKVVKVQLYLKNLLKEAAQSGESLQIDVDAIRFDFNDFPKVWIHYEKMPDIVKQICNPYVIELRSKEQAS